MDVKSVRPKGPLLSQGMRPSCPPPVAQKRDDKAGHSDKEYDTCDDGKASPPPSPRAVVDLSKIGPDAIREIYAAMHGNKVSLSSKFKHFTTTTSTFPLAGAGSTSPYPMGDIPQGSGEDEQRLGLQARVRSCTLRAYLTWSNQVAVANVGSATQTPNPIGVMVLWDKMPAIGAAVLATDTLPPSSDAAILNTNGLGSTYNDIATYNYMTHGTRFEILYHKVHMPPLTAWWSTTNTYCGHVMRLEEEIQCHDRLVTWYGTGGSNILENRLLVLFYCDPPFASQSTSTCWFSTDMRFVDMPDA